MLNNTNAHYVNSYFDYDQPVPFFYEIDIQNDYQCLLEIRQELYLSGDSHNNQKIIEDSLTKGMQLYLSELIVSREMSDF
jgi:hypothetical protein